MEDCTVVSLLQQILDDALSRRCSDVHLFTAGSHLTVQLRLAGQLIPYVELDEWGPTMMRRVKALAKMDVTESRTPQDGSFRWVNEVHAASVRVACLPTVDGEAVVLRLLPEQREPLDFSALGMTPEQSQTLHELLELHSGLLLVAGPTSSGKTTTLYTMMTQLARAGRRVVSIEDPVEQIVAACHQVEVHERLGITFESGLRALLRHDPDVIMVGEIRDGSTAETAMRASLTGHLVLSTTHADDLVGAVARLVDLGLAREMVGEAVRAVIVQRLSVSHVDLRRSRSTDVTVLRERSGIFQIYQMTRELATLISSERSWASLRLQMDSQGVRQPYDAR